MQSIYKVCYNIGIVGIMRAFIYYSWVNALNNPCNKNHQGDNLESEKTGLTAPCEKHLPQTSSRCGLLNNAEGNIL